MAGKFFTPAEQERDSAVRKYNPALPAETEGRTICRIRPGGKVGRQNREPCYFCKTVTGFPCTPA